MQFRSKTFYITEIPDHILYIAISKRDTSVCVCDVRITSHIIYTNKHLRRPAERNSMASSVTHTYLPTSVQKVEIADDVQ